MATEINQDALAESFRACVQKTLEQHCLAVFTKDPKVTMRDLIEYQSRMRVFGLEKFNDLCYITILELFESPAEEEAKELCGTLIIYVEEENAEKLFKPLLKGGEDADYDEEVFIEQTQILAGALFENLKKELIHHGYPNILVGEPQNYMNNIEEGAPFPYQEYTFYQVDCTLWKEKVVVAELVLAQAKYG